MVLLLFFGGFWQRLQCTRPQTSAARERSERAERLGACRREVSSREVSLVSSSLRFVLFRLVSSSRLASARLGSPRLWLLLISTRFPFFADSGSKVDTFWHPFSVSFQGPFPDLFLSQFLTNFGAILEVNIHEKSIIWVLKIRIIILQTCSSMFRDLGEHFGSQYHERQ